MKNKCVISWSDIVNFYTYYQLRENNIRNFTIDELRIFQDSIESTSEDQNTTLLISEDEYISFEDYILSHPELFGGRISSKCNERFYVLPHIEPEILQRSILHIDFLTYNLLKLSYENRFEY